MHDGDAACHYHDIIDARRHLMLMPLTFYAMLPFRHTPFFFTLRY